MKKLTLLLSIFICSCCFAQKNITVTNLTSSAMKIYGIRTKPSVGTYPYCYGYAFALYPGQSYTLVNNLSTTKFPFYSSPTSLPPVVSGLNWTRVNSATNSLTNQTGTSLWNNAFAASQNFNYVDFSIGSINGNPGNFGTIGVSTPGGVLTNPTGGWEAYYDFYQLSPTSSEVTITFIDL
ncbi:hypothetical protein [Flavobacterium sp. BFFFF1]|uniref:hypothetical protein n=1 Tax=Flavobacterium sp. BFFFF1 TaxID=2015557 RepID=UPI0025C00443|nr:hypothetical protein [Flavobacterium sp. BFFFF1]